MAVKSGGERAVRGNGWRLAGWSLAALALVVPLIAMLFTGEVRWNAFDFAFMAALLGSVGLGLELAARRAGDSSYLKAAGLALGAAFLLIWINGAVGIIGTEAEDANILYAGVLLVALFGSAVARMRPAGMARAMTATALAQVAVLPAASAWTPLAWSVEVMALTVVFAAMWLLSASLFRKAAAQGRRATLC